MYHQNRRRLLLSHRRRCSLVLWLTLIRSCLQAPWLSIRRDIKEVKAAPPQNTPVRPQYAVEPPVIAGNLAKYWRQKEKLANYCRHAPQNSAMPQYSLDPESTSTSKIRGRTARSTSSTRPIMEVKAAPPQNICSDYVRARSANGIS